VRTQYEFISFHSDLALFLSTIERVAASGVVFRVHSISNLYSKYRLKMRRRDCVTPPFWIDFLRVFCMFSMLARVRAVMAPMRCYSFFLFIVCVWCSKSILLYHDDDA